MSDRPAAEPAAPAGPADPASPASPISLHDVHRRFGSLQALAGVSMRVQAGEFVSLLGPSGCGKSTVLRLVAGLDDPDQGRIVSPARAPGAASTAFVFQEPTLMPWATVLDNVGLPLKLQGLARADVAARSRAVLQRVGLADFEQAWPATLSGGMKMRASIARALVARPRVLLMDEPFAALDELTRQRLNADLLQWWAQERMSVIFVTHSVTEAVFLSQRVLVMAARPGRIVHELRVAGPAPDTRPAGFRHEPAFVAACRELSQALEAGMGASAGTRP